LPRCRDGAFFRQPDSCDALVELVFGQEVEELGEDGATFVHKVENRRNAGSHPQGIVAELKSKNDRTRVLSSF
jgi:hypothetical protein